MDDGIRADKRRREELKDELYCKFELSENDFKQDELDGFELCVDEAPLFKYAEYGQQLRRVIERFLRENPETEFSAYYECSFSTCGDTTMITYDYDNGVLRIETRNADLPYLDFCEECEYEFCDEDGEFAPLVRLEGWSPDEVYVCPECGAKLEFNGFLNVEEIQIAKFSA